MGGRLGRRSIHYRGRGGTHLPLFLTFPYTQIARQAGYRFQSLYHFGQKRICAYLTFTLELQGRSATTPARSRIRPLASRLVPKSERTSRIILAENSPNIRLPFYVAPYTEEHMSNALQVHLRCHSKWVYPGLQERQGKPTQTVYAVRATSVKSYLHACDKRFQTQNKEQLYVYLYA